MSALLAKAALVAAGCAAALCACATAPRPSPFAFAARSEPGTVLQVRPVVSVLTGTQSDTADAQVHVAVIGDTLHSGETALGLSYTVRRASDGASVEVVQPAGPVLAAGTRVRILYEDKVRLVAE